MRMWSLRKLPDVVAAVRQPAPVVSTLVVSGKTSARISSMGWGLGRLDGGRFRVWR